MPKISNYTRTRIELLYSQGFHPAGIFKTLKSEGLQVSLSGITRLIKKLCLNSFVANLPRSGRPKKLSMEARAFIDQQMRRNDETKSTKIRKKLVKHGILVSSSTVRRSRKQKIYYYNDQNRLMFCLFWYRTKLEIFILGKLSEYFLSLEFVT